MKIGILRAASSRAMRPHHHQQDFGEAPLRTQVRTTQAAIASTNIASKKIAVG